MGPGLKGAGLTALIPGMFYGIDEIIHGFYTRIQQMESELIS